MAIKRMQISDLVDRLIWVEIGKSVRNEAISQVSRQVWMELNRQVSRQVGRQVKRQMVLRISEHLDAKL